MAKLYIKRFGGYMMHSFMNDYSEGAHPRILELLVKSNFQQNKGYGEDVHSERAREYIRRALKREDVDIHFSPGGTMTNLLVISALLRPHQCVISPDTGHINVHETGAIEATGHKVIATPSVEGKLTPGSIQAALDYHKGEHMVQPKIIYISNSTELGTIDWCMALHRRNNHTSSELLLPSQPSCWHGRPAERIIRLEIRLQIEFLERNPWP
jgi:threonine aldolase